jgi:23S rRNA pseudouridine1911/1915/1917 synthase
LEPETLAILYEDNHLLAVNKRASDIVQGDRTGDRTLADRVSEHLRSAYGKPGNVFVGIPHRLDRPTSGVVLFARTEKALQRLSAMFREGGVRKIYWAVVAERPPAESGSLVGWLKRNPVQNKSYAVKEDTEGAKEARLTYRLLFSLERYHLLEIELHTGRHHQIRAQLAAVGCHIKGDLKYGAARSNPGGGIHLHARQVSLVHPVRRTPLVITADPPADPVWDAALRLWRETAEKREARDDFGGDGVARSSGV